MILLEMFEIPVPAAQLRILFVIVGLFVQTKKRLTLKLPAAVISSSLRFRML